VARRSLRLELLVNLGFVTSSAVILVGLNTVLLLGGDLREAWRPLVAVWIGSTVVFVLFGASLVHRLVIRPLGRLADEAERWLGKPVIAINAAIWWMALRDNGVEDKVYGCGRLLRE